MITIEGRTLLNRCLSYDDVLLVPRYSNIQSRAEIDISVDLGRGLSLPLPILASPMDTVSEEEMACAMNASGGAGIIHRYNSVIEQVQIIDKATQLGATSIGAAVGVSGDFMQRAQCVIQAGATFICVDIAHGHHVMMKEALGQLREAVGAKTHIMAGNVATLEGVNDLADWGADSVRCNIGGGSICSTRIQTGHGLPGLQTIMDCAKTDRDITIIADGGIRNSGDMVKALAAGADAVMCGSLLSGTDETPGQILKDQDGQQWKTYRGMASKEAQIKWRGKYSSFEGVSARVPYRGPVGAVLADLEKGIRSGFSYSGARTLIQLQSTARFVVQTAAGQSESRAHIVHRQW
jgi:IMP dehydrogenase